ncbi:hypothetical protein LTR91_022735 [Friedmanniomyces endolithicus]|uniref:FAD dependent oxidoreductase domain-containing protein n=1 Tax=Friedmanniomyces endolithicus TaxID=329885 RepID=A0AAN6JYZ1_9PEZI|nr:hypothetical protein LTR35_013463 [Friedmanniomyces endolithicus]KAK0280549.1 hypothetical protein LTS00_012978 [Friedmanniomyces endolithicus]KAK0307184.1 hypothetical protein LTR01_005830 [Friedmanniomyces endolithicus]KAK0955659.1 hypothetical protein LTR91_022735 [Friedmanniomyces endolithicus]KAK1012611.1 hypothetical protein LTR54_004538 [Friedmanniomyces endolithicus]
MPSPLEKDPGLPVSDPTVPFWQLPSHPLASTSSGRLPTSTDVVMIGSGMTGCSVAKGLLEGDPGIRVCVLEARGLASGATSRNGGHIVSPSVGDFAELVECFGVKAAVEIAEFTLRNIEMTFDAVAEFPESTLATDSKIRRTTKVLAYTDQKAFDNAQHSLREWNQHMPVNRKDLFKMMSSDEVKAKFGLKNVAGASVGPGAAVWPYLLWCGLWSLLFERYSDRLAIETFTPVHAVSEAPSGDDRPGRYVVKTSRGEIRASHVVYCTNGFTSHLLPSLRDEKSGVRSASLYYLTQDIDTGYMMLGGEYEKPEDLVCSDDSKVNSRSSEEIVKVLPKHFERSGAPQVKSLWSGIMGFSRDGIPMIGRLPEEVTGRREDGEWLAAGFNGYGTGYCYSCGLAIALMLLGKDVSGWVPSALMITKERLRGSLSTGTFWDGLVGPSVEAERSKL